MVRVEPESGWEAMRASVPRALAGRDASDPADGTLPTDHLVFAPGGGGLSAGERVAVRALAAAREHLAQPALVSGGRARRDVRRSEIVWLSLGDDTAWLFARVFSLAMAANRVASWEFELTGPSERLQLALYDERDQGMFGWHLDLGPGGAATRKISVVVELESATRGGFLQFSPTAPTSVIADLGAAVVFPAYLPHRLTAVEAGRRLSLTAWICGPPFR